MQRDAFSATFHLIIVCLVRYYKEYELVIYCVSVSGGSICFECGDFV